MLFIAKYYIRFLSSRIKANWKILIYRSQSVLATGRRLDSALKTLKQYGIPQPDVLISGLGIEIHCAPNLTNKVRSCE